MRMFKFAASLIAALAMSAGAYAQQGGGVVGIPPFTGCATWSSTNILTGTGSSCSGGGGSGTVTSVGFTGGLISVATPTTTPAFTVAGTSGGVPYFSSTSTWATSGVLAANALVIGGGVGAAPVTTTTGTGVLTALGLSVTGSGGIVLATSPTLVTPTLGDAAGTSLALGGATIGSNALAVTGSFLLGSAIATGPASATLQLGAADASSAVAQTLQVQSVVAGTNNAPGADFSIYGSKSTGTGAGGSIKFYTSPAGSTPGAQNAGVLALTIDSTKLATFAGRLQAATLALGGATIGSNALAVTGTALFNNDISIASSRSILFAGNAYIDTATAGEYRFLIGGIIKFRLDGTGFWPNTANSIDVGLVGNEVRYVRAYNLSTKPVAVGSLPAAATAGSGTRAFVNDALTPVYGSTVTGGGAAKVPVYSDGTNWIVG